MKTDPDKVWCRSFATVKDLADFLAEMRKRRISDKTQELMVGLASHAPERRLTINLKHFLGLSMLKSVDNVLTDGLTDFEKRALVELDSCGMSVRLREVAHGLLNVHERWKLRKAMNEPFTRARAAHTNFIPLDQHVLDSVLGKEHDNAS